MKTVSFNLEGRDYFIDFLKAYAILCVLFAHTFPFLQEVGYGLWAGMQVPIFLLVQSFHALKANKKLNLYKIFWRIFIPFLLAQLLIITVDGVKNGFGSVLIIKCLCRGGYGPGAYYPWIYLQLSIIIPFLRGLMSRKSNLINALILIVICEVLEVSYSLLGFPDSVYRLLCIRYIFLIYLGWKWVKEGICMTKTTICLSLFSLILCVYFGYIANDTEPFLFNTSWKFHRWPCYYYVSHLYAYVLYLLYSIVSKSKIMKEIIGILSQSSYEIFLVQMVLIYLIPNTHQSETYSSLWMLTMWVISLTIGITIYKLRTFQWKRNSLN